MLKPLPTPDTYRILPQKVEMAAKAVQMSLGLDGEEAPRAKRLAGEYVFFYLRSRKNPSPKTKGAFDPEDYDYGDDEDDDDEDYANQFADYDTDSEEDGV